jgi:hypothetical protein
MRKRLASYVWALRKWGPLGLWRYERLRLRREKELGRKFDTATDGEPLLRALGYGDDVVARAKERGLA